MTVPFTEQNLADEKAAREMLARGGFTQALDCPSGHVMEVANLIADLRDTRKELTALREELELWRRSFPEAAQVLRQRFEAAAAREMRLE